ncbi:LysR family transcriptional regulator [Aquitalea sp. LB_tupeE]|uniref:LysR family transcriptional regulator n=1 Tax=Aquitalea sp. LB_tupeE TaxID=2748078 RepID=UPI0015C001DF|nr:LysR family transcriptional regulator [Aquitalea sp. LB_tupeE]NWK76405.1 LysR family transcriptional regulator [Aquitalea sp. LB_tupeE]
MNLRQIDYVLAVAEEESFTRAAERCHTVQSALSHQIARLEQEFAARLFERTSRQVTLTPAGQTFVKHARQVREAAQRLEDEMAAATGEIRGSLRIGCISTLGRLDLPALLAQYHRRHPQVDIKLSMGMSDVMMDELRVQQIDVAFLGVWPGEPVLGLDARLLWEEPLLALLRPDHPLAALPQLDLQQLAGCTLVDWPAGSGPRQQTDMAFAAQGIKRRVCFEVNHADMLVSLVQTAAAVGMVPAMRADQHAGLVALPVRDGPRRRVYLASHESPTPATAAFLSLLNHHLPPDPDGANT